MRSTGCQDTVVLNEREQPYPRLRVPQDLPLSISRHLVPVTKHEDIFKDFHARRDHGFRHLIRRFMYQILYGCTNPLCTTPTCLSYRKRVTKAPLRTLTRLSARALACHLASEPNSLASLCSHCPQVYPDFEPVSQLRKWPRRKSHNVTFEAEAKPYGNPAAQKAPPNEHVVADGNQRARPGVLRSSSQEAFRSHDNPAQTNVGKEGDPGWIRLEADLHASADGPVRDAKSFTQSLFDTVPLRMLEWLPFTTQPVTGHQPFLSSTGDNPRTSGDDKGVGAKTSSQPSAIPVDRLNQRVLSAILQRPPGQVPPDPPPKKISMAMRKSCRGDVCSVSSSEEKQTRRIAARTAEQGRVRRRSSDAGSPASVAILANRPPSLSTKTLPTLSRSSTQIRAANPILDAGKQEQNRDESHERYVADDSNQTDGEQDPHDSTFAKARQSNTICTHTLGRISQKTLQELRSTQDKIEEQCFGYQLTGYPSWMELPKPRENLALVFSDWTAFIQQSCFYLLKDSARLAYGFEWDGDAHKMAGSSMWPTAIDPNQGLEIFKALYSLRPPHESLQALSHSLDHVDVGTSELLRPFRWQMQPDSRSGASSAGKHVGNRAPAALSNQQASFVFAVVLYALSGLTAIEHCCSAKDHVKSCWSTFCALRSRGRIFSMDVIMPSDKTPACHMDLLKVLTDSFSDETALDLVSKLAQIVGNRMVFSEVTKKKDTQVRSKRSKTRRSVLHLLMQYLKDFSKCESWPRKLSRPLSLASTTLEWLRTIVLRDWDGEPIVRRAGSIGGSLQLLAAMYDERSELRLETEAFHTPFFVERLDAVEMPVDWLSYRPENKNVHLLSYSFLFPPSALATYFRSLNYDTMSTSFERALITTKQVYQFGHSEVINIADREGLSTAMEPSMANFFVLNVRRDRVLTDAMNQLWRRTRTELMVPLKVRMGMNEGEEGVDHGGVQQEFFRCLLTEALEPDHGMFTVDLETRMTWFTPGSLEPLYKFEMLGTLFSIAVYNSITLPVTFPLAFYRKLLGLPVKKLSHIRDGWPVLARGLQELLDWSDGDVSDVFTRTYEFSYDAFGQRIDVDIRQVSPSDPPSSNIKRSEAGHSTPSRNQEPCPRGSSNLANREEDFKSDRGDAPVTAASSSPPPLVTNSNRAEYVKDYIHHLTNASISPQYTAFQKGFLTCLAHPPSTTTTATKASSNTATATSTSTPTPTSISTSTLSIFRNHPEILQSVVEGQHQAVSSTELERVTRYEDGYHADHPTIRLFWDVVHHDFDDRKRRRLLEFVMATDRVPVGGLDRIEFVVQRCGTGDADRSGGGGGGSSSGSGSGSDSGSGHGTGRGGGGRGDGGGGGGGRLPTSMTCFGRLLLPEYKHRQVLKEKLEKAIENCRGFGVA